MTDFHDLVIPAQEAPITGGVILRRVPDGIETNIPHRVVEHSPSGYEWGFAGSGPADLALNILESALLAIGHQGQRVECYRGSCFRLAQALHQAYKFEVIAGVPHEGTVIYWPALRGWIEERAAAAGLCLTCGEDPRLKLTPDDYGMTGRDGWTCPGCGAWRPAEMES